MRRFTLVLFVLLIAVSASAAPIVLRVDASNAPSNLFHAHLTIPATPGATTLYYPKWIPGEHSPTGPLVGLTGLKITANGAPVTWQRDPVEMFAFHVDVPAGASALEVDLDYLAFAGGAIFTSGASSSPKLAVLSWNTVALYPQGGSPEQVSFAPSVIANTPAATIARSRSASVNGDPSRLLLRLSTPATRPL